MFTTQAWPSYFTMNTGLSGHARSSSSRESSLPSSTEYGEAPNATRVFDPHLPANSDTISMISRLERAAITFSPALNVAKEARCS